MSFNIPALSGSFDLSDGQSGVTNIPGLLLDPTVAKSYILNYSLEKHYSSGITAGQEDVAFSDSLGNFQITSGSVFWIAKQSTGKILLFGQFSPTLATYNGTSLKFLVRLNTDYTIDTTFNNGGAGFAFSFSAGPSVLQVQSDDKIIIGTCGLGGTVSYNGTTINGIMRLNSDGTLDTAFQTNVGTGCINPTAQPLLYLQNNGQIVFGGVFTTFNGVSRPGLIRLNTDGTLDTTFSTNVGTAGAAAGMFAACETSGGLLLIGGGFRTFNGNTRGLIVALNANGTENAAFQTNLGTAFGNDGSANKVSSLVPQGTQTLIGFFDSLYKGNTRNGLIRLNSDGTEDTTFYTNISPGFSNGLTGAIETVQGVVVEPSGHILVGGAFMTVHGVAKQGIYRLNSDGTSETTFNAGISPGFTFLNTAYGAGTMFVVSDGILIGGFFTAYNGFARSNFCKLQFNTIDSYLTGGVINIHRYYIEGGKWLTNNMVSFSDTQLGITISVTSAGQYQYTSNTPVGTKVINRIRWTLIPL
jgi:uncharacterized delta-60 repeat protein